MPNGRSPLFSVDPKTGRPISRAIPISGKAFHEKLMRDPRFAGRFGRLQQQVPGARTTPSNVPGGSLGATRAGLGALQGPPRSQRRMAFPGLDPRRDVFGGRQFGAARSRFRDILRRGSFGRGGGFGRQPLSFGILGRGFGRLGQRTR